MFFILCVLYTEAQMEHTDGFFWEEMHIPEAELAKKRGFDSNTMGLRYPIWYAACFHHHFEFKLVSPGTRQKGTDFVKLASLDLATSNAITRHPDLVFLAAPLAKYLQNFHHMALDIPVSFLCIVHKVHTSHSCCVIYTRSLCCPDFSYLGLFVSPKQDPAFQERFLPSEQFNLLQNTLGWYKNSSAQIRVFQCLEMKHPKAEGMQRVRCYPFRGCGFQKAERNLKDPVFLMPLEAKDDFCLPEDTSLLQYGRVLLFFSVQVPGRMGNLIEVDLAFIKYYDVYKIKGNLLTLIVCFIHIDVC